ncbi:hypothetical protein [Mycolicibacterium sp.]|uniref:hypothetical protein n=1 Tax=Mycolicibacterium sp. TaxID=2320850 RepID=UPI0037C638E0
MQKMFDYAAEREDGNVEVRFTDGSRYDVPTPEWAAIVEAANEGFLSWTALGDDD